MNEMKQIAIPVRLSGKNIEKLAERYHFDPSALPRIREVYETALPRIQAKACFCLRGSYALCAVTLGRGPDELQELYGKRGAVEDAYVLDCIGSALLEDAYERLDEELYKAAGLWPGPYEFPGAELPLEQIGEILMALKGGPVSCNEAYALSPGKSVAFRCSLRPKREKEKGCGVCGSCPRRDCESRRRDGEEAE